MFRSAITTALLASAAIALASAAPAQEVPPEAQERGFLLLPEYHAMMPGEREAMDAFMERVRADATPLENPPKEPIQICSPALKHLTPGRG